MFKTLSTAAVTVALLVPATADAKPKPKPVKAKSVSSLIEHNSFPFRCASRKPC